MSADEMPQVQINVDELLADYQLQIHNLNTELTMARAQILALGRQVQEKDQELTELRSKNKTTKRTTPKKT